MRRNQLTALLLAALLFASGVFVGALGHRYYTTSVVRAKSQDDARQHYLSEMQAKLKLSPDQVAKLEAIMADTKSKFRALHDTQRPLAAKIKQEHIERVRSILTADQLPEYERLRAEHDRRAQENERRDH